jgi:spermidine/putrescine-binding protein
MSANSSSAWRPSLADRGGGRSRPSGGAYQEANQKAFFTSFTQATGIEVVISNLSVTGPILASVKQNQIQIDILDTNESDLMILEVQGALAPIDYENMKLFKASDIHASVVRPNMVGKTYWASVMVYRTDAFPKDGYPKTWADFWDVKRFPGARSLQGSPGKSNSRDSELMSATGLCRVKTMRRAPR